MNFKPVRDNSPYHVSADGRVMEGMRKYTPRIEPETGLPFIYYNTPSGHLDKMYLHVAVYRKWGPEAERDTVNLTKDQVKFANPKLKMPGLCAIGNLKRDNSEEPSATIAEAYVSKGAESKAQSADSEAQGSEGEAQSSEADAQGGGDAEAGSVESEHESKSSEEDEKAKQTTEAPKEEKASGGNKSGGSKKSGGNKKS